MGINIGRLPYVKIKKDDNTYTLNEIKVRKNGVETYIYPNQYIQLFVDENANATCNLYRLESKYHNGSTSSVDTLLYPTVNLGGTISSDNIIYIGDKIRYFFSTSNSYEVESVKVDYYLPFSTYEVSGNNFIFESFDKISKTLIKSETLTLDETLTMPLRIETTNESLKKVSNNYAIVLTPNIRGWQTLFTGSYTLTKNDYAIAETGNYGSFAKLRFTVVTENTNEGFSYTQTFEITQNIGSVSLNGKYSDPDIKNDQTIGSINSGLYYVVESDKEYGDLYVSLTSNSTLTDKEGNTYTAKITKIEMIP